MWGDNKVLLEDFYAFKAGIRGNTKLLRERARKANGRNWRVQELIGPELGHRNVKQREAMVGIGNTSIDRGVQQDFADLFGIYACAQGRANVHIQLAIISHSGQNRDGEQTTLGE